MLSDMQIIICISIGMLPGILMGSISQYLRDRRKCEKCEYQHETNNILNPGFEQSDKWQEITADNVDSDTPTTNLKWPEKFEEWHNKNMKPPNKRKADCCATCAWGAPNFNLIECDEYGPMLHENICDDYKREEG